MFQLCGVLFLSILLNRSACHLPCLKNFTFVSYGICVCFYIFLCASVMWWYYIDFVVRIRVRVRVIVFSSTFNNISVISWRSVCIGGENRSSQWKPQTCRKSLTIYFLFLKYLFFLYHIVMYRIHLTWTGLKPTTLGMIYILIA
jgi:hypothetical protein